MTSDTRPSPVTRFEVIDHRKSHDLFAGRAFVAAPCSIELSYQDDGRTLKVFVTDPQPINTSDSPARPESPRAADTPGVAHRWSGRADDPCSCGYSPDDGMTVEAFNWHVNIEWSAWPPARPVEPPDMGVTLAEIDMIRAEARQEADAQIARLSEALRPFVEGTDDLETARHEAKRALASQPDIAARPDFTSVQAGGYELTPLRPDIAAGAPTDE